MPQPELKIGLPTAASRFVLSRNAVRVEPETSRRFHPRRVNCGHVTRPHARRPGRPSPHGYRATCTAAATADRAQRTTVKKSRCTSGSATPGLFTHFTFQHSTDSQDRYPWRINISWPLHENRQTRNHYRQREKTLDERLREEIVSVNVDDAYSSLVEYRKQASEISAETVTLDKCKDRATITAAKQPNAGCDPVGCSWCIGRAPVAGSQFESEDRVSVHASRWNGRPRSWSGFKSPSKFRCTKCCTNFRQSGSFGGTPCHFGQSARRPNSGI